MASVWGENKLLKGGVPPSLSIRLGSTHLLVLWMECQFLYLGDHNLLPLALYSGGKNQAPGEGSSFLVDALLVLFPRFFVEKMPFWLPKFLAQRMVWKEVLHFCELFYTQGIPLTYT